VLGINNVNLTIPPGITSWWAERVRQNHVMNLMTGLLRPTRGEIRVLGVAPDRHNKSRLAAVTARSRRISKGTEPAFQFIYSYPVLAVWHEPGGSRERAVAALQKVQYDGRRRPPGGCLQQRHAPGVKLASGISLTTRACWCSMSASMVGPDGSRRNHRSVREWGPTAALIVYQPYPCTK